MTQETFSCRLVLHPDSAMKSSSTYTAASVAEADAVDHLEDSVDTTRVRVSNLPNVQHCCKLHITTSEQASAKGGSHVHAKIYPLTLQCSAGHFQPLVKLQLERLLSKDQLFSSVELQLS